ncbi:hypothetical protein Gohar_008630 [Gossypium harknessii]|uniref:Aminotransferase-like plant mobile domain-containing protein n=1 Tax=Gossypium harknessii TaxID=34285 RepID=A0A7J9GKA8_9ROSI|nr:hypothetical protein [Gossypium harknessii]
MLATLYREMCRATKPNKDKIRGCLSLLQSWARFRFPFLRPLVLDNEHESTYDNRICIGRYSSRNISKFGKIDMIIYLLMNRSSFQS